MKTPKNKKIKTKQNKTKQNKRKQIKTTKYKDLEKRMSKIDLITKTGGEPRCASKQFLFHKRHPPCY